MSTYRCFKYPDARAYTYASVIGVMLPGSKTSILEGARFTFAELTSGGEVLSKTAAALSCRVVFCLAR